MDVANDQSNPAVTKNLRFRNPPVQPGGVTALFGVRSHDQGLLAVPHLKSHVARGNLGVLEKGPKTSLYGDLNFRIGNGTEWSGLYLENATPSFPTPWELLCSRRDLPWLLASCLIIVFRTLNSIAEMLVNCILNSTSSFGTSVCLAAWKLPPRH